MKLKNCSNCGSNDTWDNAPFGGRGMRCRNCENWYGFGHVVEEENPKHKYANIFGEERCVYCKIKKSETKI